MKYLEDWAREIVQRSVGELNREFKDSPDVERSIEALPFWSWHRNGFRTLSPEVLHQLHNKIRRQKCEWCFWESLLRYLTHAIPDEIAHDLINRDMTIGMLGHTRQSDEVMWRLVPLMPEALLTMGVDIYVRPQHSAEELQSLLERFPHHEWLMSRLAHCVPDVPEKREILEPFLQQQEKAEWLLDIMPLFSRLAWHAPQSSQEHQAPAPEQLIELYGTRDGEKLLALTKDATTPDEILEELKTLRGVPHAARIRQVADLQLRQRQAQEEL